jgi:hypothetical protein
MTRAADKHRRRGCRRDDRCASPGAAVRAGRWPPSSRGYASRSRRAALGGRSSERRRRSSLQGVTPQEIAAGRLRQAGRWPPWLLPDASQGAYREEQCRGVTLRRREIGRGPLPRVSPLRGGWPRGVFWLCAASREVLAAVALWQRRSAGMVPASTTGRCRFDGAGRAPGMA